MQRSAGYTGHRRRLLNLRSLVHATGLGPRQRARENHGHMPHRRHATGCRVRHLHRPERQGHRHQWQTDHERDGHAAALEHRQRPIYPDPERQRRDVGRQPREPRARAGQRSLQLGCSGGLLRNQGHRARMRLGGEPRAGGRIDRCAPNPAAGGRSGADLVLRPLSTPAPAVATKPTAAYVLKSVKTAANGSISVTLVPNQSGHATFSGTVPTAKIASIVAVEAKAKRKKKGCRKGTIEDPRQVPAGDFPDTAARPPTATPA